MLLLPYPVIDPIALHIGSFKIHWYGIAYVAGIALGWMYGSRLLQHMQLPINKQDLDDFIPWVTLGIVLGGRLGHALFYNGQYYFHKPWEIFYIWHPGMSFHGGFLGVLFATLWFTHKRKIPLRIFVDILGACTPIGLFFGRIANFINGELFGRFTDVSWAIIFPMGGPLSRHPSQLYEAFLEGIVLFILGFYLCWMKRMPEHRPGLTVSVFLIGYSISRIVIEMFREPDQQIGYLWGGTTLGQWLSLPLIILGFGVIYQCLRTSRSNIHL